MFTLTMSYKTTAFCFVLFLFFVFKVYFIDYATTVVSSFFLPFIPLGPAPPPTLQHSPTPLIHVHGLYYKFLVFSISYTVLNLPLSSLYLPFMLLIPCTFSPILLPPPPHWWPSMWSLFLWFCPCSSCFCSLGGYFFRFNCWQLWIGCNFNVHSSDLLLFLR